MSIGQCTCPDCGTTLRVRDRSFIGRQIECPDCQAKLVIKLNDQRELVAERPKAEPAQEASRRLVVPATRVGSAVGARLGDILHSPLALAWALAIGITAFVAIMMLRPSVRFQSPAKPQSQPIGVADPTDNQASKDNSQQIRPVDVAEKTPEKVSMNTTAPNDSVSEVMAPVRPDASAADVPSVEKPNDITAAPAPKLETVPKPIVPIPVKINVEERLQQRFNGYATGKSVSRERLIEELEEMLGAPIRIRYSREELGEKNLERSVSINLNSTTLGGILKALVDSAGWEFVFEDNAIRLKPRQMAGPVSP